MDKNYIISVTGIQEVEGEKDKVEVITEGDMVKKNGHTYISYKEYNEDNPKICSHNLIKIENDGKITVIRKGETESRLILEKDKRHQCCYRTMAGNLMIGIFTEDVDIDLKESGGKLRVKYSIDFNNDLMSKNELRIKIKTKTK